MPLYGFDDFPIAELQHAMGEPMRQRQQMALLDNDSDGSYLKDLKKMRDAGSYSDQERTSSLIASAGQIAEDAGLGGHGSRDKQTESEGLMPSKWDRWWFGAETGRDEMSFLAGFGRRLKDRWTYWATSNNSLNVHDTQPLQTMFGMELSQDQIAMMSETGSSLDATFNNLDAQGQPLPNNNPSQALHNAHRRANLFFPWSTNKEIDYIENIENEMELREQHPEMFAIKNIRDDPWVKAGYFAGMFIDESWLLPGIGQGIKGLALTGAVFGGVDGVMYSLSEYGEIDPLTVALGVTVGSAGTALVGGGIIALRSMFTQKKIYNEPFTSEDVRKIYSAEGIQSTDEFAALTASEWNLKLEMGNSIGLITMAEFKAKQTASILYGQKWSQDVFLAKQADETGELGKVVDERAAQEWSTRVDSLSGGPTVLFPKAAKDAGGEAATATTKKTKKGQSKKQSKAAKAKEEKKGLKMVPTDADSYFHTYYPNVIKGKGPMAANDPTQTYTNRASNDPIHADPISDNVEKMLKTRSPEGLGREKLLQIAHQPTAKTLWWDGFPFEDGSPAAELMKARGMYDEFKAFTEERGLRMDEWHKSITSTMDEMPIKHWKSWLKDKARQQPAFKSTMEEMLLAAATSHRAGRAADSLEVATKQKLRTAYRVAKEAGARKAVEAERAAVIHAKEQAAMETRIKGLDERGASPGEAREIARITKEFGFELSPSELREMLPVREALRSGAEMKALFANSTLAKIQAGTFEMKMKGRTVTIQDIRFAYTTPTKNISRTNPLEDALASGTPKRQRVFHKDARGFRAKINGKDLGHIFPSKAQAMDWVYNKIQFQETQAHIAGARAQFIAGTDGTITPRMRDYTEMVKQYPDGAPSRVSNESKIPGTLGINAHVTNTPKPSGATNRPPWDKNRGALNQDLKKGKDMEAEIRKQQEDHAWESRKKNYATRYDREMMTKEALLGADGKNIHLEDPDIVWMNAGIPLNKILEANKAVRAATGAALGMGMGFTDPDSISSSQFIGAMMGAVVGLGAPWMISRMLPRMGRNGPNTYAEKIAHYKNKHIGAWWDNADTLLRKTMSKAGYDAAEGLSSMHRGVAAFNSHNLHELQKVMLTAGITPKAFARWQQNAGLRNEETKLFQPIRNAMQNRKNRAAIFAAHPEIETTVKFMDKTFMDIAEAAKDQGVCC